MTSPFHSPERVPASAVERLLKNSADLLQTAETVLEALPPTAPSRIRWQRVTDLLHVGHRGLQQEAASFHEGDREPLLQHASELRLLTRRMDGCAVPAATAAEFEAMAAARQLLVLTAWQIAAAASGSEAAGL